MNLIITCARHYEYETELEITNILDEIGDSNPQITTTEFSGILYVNTSANPLDMINRIRQKIEDEPWSIRYTMRAIPVEALVETQIRPIIEAASSLAKKMSKDDSYRITIEKRNSGIASEEIITQIANKIPNRVSLKNYDWVVLVEILGTETGISVLKDSNILSIQREKRGSLE